MSLIARSRSCGSGQHLRRRLRSVECDKLAKKPKLAQLAALGREEGVAKLGS